MSFFRSSLKRFSSFAGAGILLVLLGACGVDRQGVPLQSSTGTDDGGGSGTQSLPPSVGSGSGSATSSSAHYRAAQEVGGSFTRSVLRSSSGRYESH